MYKGGIDFARHDEEGTETIASTTRTQIYTEKVESGLCTNIKGRTCFLYIECL